MLIRDFPQQTQLSQYQDFSMHQLNIFDFLILLNENYFHVNFIIQT